MGMSTWPAWAIREADAKDQEFINGFQERLNRPSRSDSVPSEYFVAVSGDQIVGCAAVRKRRNIGYLYGLAVDKGWRRQGIGHALTHARLEWLRAQGAECAFVMAMFWNVRFFQKHSFSLVSRGVRGSLSWLHGDFTDQWTNKSALLSIPISETRLNDGCENGL